MEPPGVDAVAEAVRAACVDAALAAYEEGGIRGLCHEGRWEYALQAIRGLDLEHLVREFTATKRPPVGS